VEGRFDGRVSDGESDLRDIGNYRRVVGTAFLSQSNSVCSSLLFFIEESKIIRRCVVSSPSILHILTKILNIPEIDHPTQPKGACSLSLKTPSTQ